ncbi:MAG TPA: hypothetical protein VLK33_07315, partial [Terriglobales bacterium]|nr:hypothetical protein [Terriglobales bacterium]
MNDVVPADLGPAPTAWHGAEFLLDLKLIRARCFRAIALSGILLFAQATLAQSPTLITLDQAIDMALAHNHAL